MRIAEGPVDRSSCEIEHGRLRYRAPRASISCSHFIEQLFDAASNGRLREHRGLPSGRVCLQAICHARPALDGRKLPRAFIGREALSAYITERQHALVVFANVEHDVHRQRDDPCAADAVLFEQHPSRLALFDRALTNRRNESADAFVIGQHVPRDGSTAR